MYDSKDEKIEQTFLVFAFSFFEKQIDGVYQKDNNADNTHRQIENNVIAHNRPSLKD